MEQENRYFLGDQELDLIEKTLDPVIKKYNRGELLFRKNMQENWICFLLGGTAYLEVENEYENKQILDYFIKGQVLCHSMMIQPNNGHCFVTAKHPCRIALVESSKIEQFRQTNPNGGLDFLPSFIFRSIVSMMQQHCHILQQKTIRNKILTFLYCQAERQNTNSIRLPIPYSDLADYLTIDRSSLMKELGKMCQENIIERNSHQITLLPTTPYF